MKITLVIALSFFILISSCAISNRRTPVYQLEEYQAVPAKTDILGDTANYDIEFMNATTQRIKYQKRNHDWVVASFIVFGVFIVILIVK